MGDEALQKGWRRCRALHQNEPLSTRQDASAPGIPPGEKKCGVSKAETTDDDKEGVY